MTAAATRITSAMPWPRIGQTMLDNARAVHAKGIQPVLCAIGGKDALAGHDIRHMTASDVARIFTGAVGNIGVMLGEASGWLVDVDVTDAASRAASVLMPPTATFGRGGAAQHWLYYAQDARFTAYKMPRSPEPFLELRSDSSKGGSCHVIIPPSIHNNSDSVSWCGTISDPVMVDHRVLARRVALVAVASLFAAHWEDVTASDVVGTMLGEGLSGDDVCAFLRACGSGENREMVEAMCQRKATGLPLRGWENLAESLDKAVITRAQDWLKKSAPHVEHANTFSDDSDVTICTTDRKSVV